MTRRDETLWREAQICYRVSKEQESSPVGHFVDNWFLWRSRINYPLAKWFTKELSGVAVDVAAGTKNCRVLSRLVDVHMSRDILFLPWVIQFRSLFLTLTLCGHIKQLGFRKPNMAFGFAVLHFWMHMAGHSRKQKILSVDGLKNILKITSQCFNMVLWIWKHPKHQITSEIMALMGEGLSCSARSGQ